MQNISNEDLAQNENARLASCQHKMEEMPVLTKVTVLKFLNTYCKAFEQDIENVIRGNAKNFENVTKMFRYSFVTSLTK